MTEQPDSRFDHPEPGSSWIIPDPENKDYEIRVNVLTTALVKSDPETWEVHSTTKRPGRWLNIKTPLAEWKATAIPLS